MIRAGRGADADRVLSDGLERLATDPRTRMPGEVALWHYKRGTARVAAGRAADARADLGGAIDPGAGGRNWVKGRAHLELGRLAQNEGNRAAARDHLQTAIRLCTSDRDALGAEQARALLNAR